MAHPKLVKTDGGAVYFSTELSYDEWQELVLWRFPSSSFVEYKEHMSAFRDENLTSMVAYYSSDFNPWIRNEGFDKTDME